MGTLPEDRQKRPNSVVIVVSLLVLLVGYAGSYLALTEKNSLFGFRDCKYQWMTIVYQPLASIEELVSGEQIQLVHIEFQPVLHIAPEVLK